MLRGRIGPATAFVIAATAPAPGRADAAEPSGPRATLLSDLDARYFPDEAEGNTGFAVARFRPGLELSPARWFRWNGAIEFAGESPVLLDANLTFLANDALTASVGLAKPPMFASFLLEPEGTGPLPEASAVVSGFGLRRDLGAMVRYRPRALPLEAYLRIGNGSGSPLGNDNGDPAAYALCDLVLGRAWTAVGPEAAAESFGLRLGVSGTWEHAEARDGIAGKTPLGFTYARPIVVNGRRLIGSAHAIAYGGPVRLTVEAALADESRARDDDGNPDTPRRAQPSVRSSGLTAEVAWVLRGPHRTVGHAPVAPAGSDGAWDGGTVEIAARYDGLFLNRDAPDVRSGGGQGGVLAVKWWPAEFLAVALAGDYTHFETRPVEAPDQTSTYTVLLRSTVLWGGAVAPVNPSVPTPETHQP